MNLIIDELDVHTREQDLLPFCNEASSLGITNNSSLKSLKMEFLKKRTSNMWVVKDTERENKIVGMAGAHHIPEISPHCYRILYRGCILPEYRGQGSAGLSKRHMNSFIFKHISPLQMRWCSQMGGNHFVITTNANPDHTGTSNTDRIFHLMAKQGAVKKIHENILLYDVIQNVWEVTPGLFE